MRLIIALLFLSLGALSYGQNVAKSTCNIDNYVFYINKPGNHRCDLRYADFSEVNLIGANFSGANLHKANLREANLYGANLSGANCMGRI